MIISRWALALAIATTGTALPAQQPVEAVADETVNLSIDEAVKLGLERSFRVQRSARNEDMAETRVDTSRAGLRPRLDTSVQASQNQRYVEFHGNAFQFNQATPSFYASANASASLPLDLWGVTRRQIKQSELSHNMSEIELAQASIDVATDIRISYVSALRAQEQVRADVEYVELLDTLLSRARTQQPSVVSFLETERSNAVQTMESTKTSADLSLSGLSQSLRLPRNVRLNLTNGLPKVQQIPSMDMLMEMAARSRNDLKQAKLRLQQARLSREQAMDSRRPKLGITAYANQGLTGRSPFFGDRDSGRNLSSGVSGTFNLPLVQYDGGVLRNSRHVANVQAEQALADAEEAMERAENEISQVLIGLNRATQRLTSLPDAEQARTALEQAESQMLRAAPGDAAGMVAQVTNARQNWRSAVVSRKDAMSDYHSGLFRLQRAIGAEELRAY